MPELSIIIPFIQEFPQILFTVRSLHEELRDIDHEIIVVDNLTSNAKLQLESKNIKPDLCHEHLDKDGKNALSCLAIAQRHGGANWLRYLYYGDIFSCWQARNYGILNSKSPFIMLIDAHCVPSRDSIVNMFRYYQKNWAKLGGSIHLPLTYQILEARKLIYSFDYQPDKGLCQYSFCGIPKQYDGTIFEVPCMSSCGMMCHRDLFNQIGLFPNKGIYSGGEHFLNFVMAIIGKKKWVYNKYGAVLHHHGAKRQYNFTWDCLQYNRITSNLMFGGEKWVDLYINNLTIDDKSKSRLRSKVMEDQELLAHRKKIENMQIIDIEDWAQLKLNTPYVLQT